jgi:hypothetical protein
MFIAGMYQRCQHIVFHLKVATALSSLEPRSHILALDGECKDVPFYCFNLSLKQQITIPLRDVRVKPFYF